MFDRVIIKTIIMFGIFVFLMLGCSNILHRTQPPTIIYKMSEPKIIYHAIHDTLYKTKQITIDESKLRLRIENLLDKSETAFGDLDEIKKLNIEIQKQNIILFNRGLQTRVKNDSLNEMVKTIRDTLTYANRKANQFYSKAKIAEQAQQENKAVNSNINWQFWIAWFGVIAMLFVNLFLTSRINKHNHKNIYA